MSEALRWPMTLALAVVAPYFASRLLRPAAGGGPARPARHRGCDAAHLLMAVAMTAMVWTVAVPGAMWVAVFAPAALWFVVLAARSPGRLPHGSRAVTWYFAVSMAAMAWMAWPNGHPGGEGHHGGPAGPPWWPSVVSLALGGYLLLTAGWWAGRGLRLTPRWPDQAGAVASPAGPTVRVEGLCHATMGAVMGLMLLAMV
ncbi:DUF5134 domain-containing protein [Micromonospora haikouensis]|uniref:DUF5134 domain-containing protein n=1 Tax=Micromonospora haikouensis TaxID=686309 RepID=UPI0036A64805